MFIRNIYVWEIELVFNLNLMIKWKNHHNVSIENWRNCVRILKSILFLQELLIELAETRLKTDLV